MPADAPKLTLAGRLGLDATASVVFVEVPPALMRLIKPVHQGLRNGIVGHQLVNGRKMIDRHRLEQRWKGLSELEVFAQRANASLDCKAWGPPPWSADQWQTTRVIIELYEE